MRYPLNGAIAITALVASCTLAWVGHREFGVSEDTVQAGVLSPQQMNFVRDFQGNEIPCRDYHRVICGGTVAAAVLPELVSVDRILMVPTWHRKTSPVAFKTDLKDRNGDSKINTLDSLASLEVLVAAKPDLILLNSLSGGTGERIQRLRSLNLNVLDLGPMLGVETLLANIRTLGQVMMKGPEGNRLAHSLERRLRRVTMAVPDVQPKSAMYIGSMGGSLIGGTEGSSFHDLLHYSGLKDAAAGKGFTPWPSYSPEQVLDINPEIIVTEYGHGQSIRSTPGFHRLRALSAEGSLIELPPGAETIGLGILDAVEALHEAVYGWPVDVDPKGMRP